MGVVKYLFFTSKSLFQGSHRDDDKESLFYWRFSLRFSVLSVQMTSSWPKWRPWFQLPLLLPRPLYGILFMVFRRCSIRTVDVRDVWFFVSKFGVWVFRFCKGAHSLSWWWLLKTFIINSEPRVDLLKQDVVFVKVSLRVSEVRRSLIKVLCQRKVRVTLLSVFGCFLFLF